MDVNADFETDQLNAAADEAAEVLKVLSNPARLRILCSLVPGPRTVSQLMVLTGASQSYVSGQLLKLRGQGLVTCERDGRQMRYALSDPRVGPILECLYDVFCPNS